MNETDTIATDNPLSPSDTTTLAAIVGLMIPASTKYDIPAANDETILLDIIGTAREHVELLRAGFDALDQIARERDADAFVDLTPADQMAVVDGNRASLEQFFGAVTSMTVQCYYRDPRVMTSLGMEVRPPFPEGFEVAAGDWSILDPVRDRGKIWRDA